jgi:two-component system chemotaxis response regulator CheB
MRRGRGRMPAHRHGPRRRPGLLRIRQAGGLTIAQDESTSVIYGMPREAALIGAATHILRLGDIGPHLGALQGMAMEAAR